MIKIRTSIQQAEAKLQREVAKVVQSVRNEFLAAKAQEDSLVNALEAQKRDALGLNPRSTPTFTRRYWYEVKGRLGWTAKYVKEVDADECTVRFCQEIYDDRGALQEIHQKYPDDLGHQKLGT